MGHNLSVDLEEGFIFRETREETFCLAWRQTGWATVAYALVRGAPTLMSSHGLSAQKMLIIEAGCEQGTELAERVVAVDDPQPADAGGFAGSREESRAARRQTAIVE